MECVNVSLSVCDVCRLPHLLACLRTANCPRLPTGFGTDENSWSNIIKEMIRIIIECYIIYQLHRPVERWHYLLL